MVIADFYVEDKASRPRFFQETFLVTDTKFEVIFGMLFLKISNADESFGEKILTWRIYIINKALSIIEQVHIVDPKKFVIAAIDVNNKTFVVHVAIRKWEEMPVHSKKQAQVRVLLFDKAPTEVPAENSDYSDIFSAENAAELPENTRINKHAIKLEEDKQPSFGPIYNLRLVELETIKTYIKINLANSFSKPFESLVGIPIFFNKKPDRSLHLCIDY